MDLHKPQMLMQINCIIFANPNALWPPIALALEFLLDIQIINWTCWRSKMKNIINFIFNITYCLS